MTPRDPAWTGPIEQIVQSEAVPDALAVTTLQDDGTFVVSVYGEVDLASSEAFSGAVQQALDSGAARIVLDLGACHFIDSTGLQVVVQLHRTTSADPDRDLLILPGPRIVRRAFETTGLLGVLPFAED